MKKSNFNRQFVKQNSLIGSGATMPFGPLSSFYESAAIDAKESLKIPQRVARMGNFNIANITENESWIITGE